MRGLESRQQGGQQGGTLGQRPDQHILSRAVGSLADAAQAIERGDSQRCGEVAVRPAAGKRFLNRVLKNV